MRTHQRVILANVAGAASTSYTVPAGYRDVVSSVVLGNTALASDAHYKIHVVSGATDVPALTSHVNAQATELLQPWITLEAGDTLTVENTGGGGDPTLHTAIGVLRYTV